MKRSILLTMTVLVFGCLSIMAQQRGGSSRRSQDRSPQPRNAGVVNREIRPVRQVSRDMPRRNTPHHKPKITVRKLVGGLHLNKKQKRQLKHILKEARENGASKKQVLREINSILNPRQSKKFKKRLRRIYNAYHNSNGRQPPPPIT